MVETFRSYDEQVLREIIRRVHPEEEQAMMSQFAQQEFAKGETAGWQRGLWEGERKGKADLLLKLLQQRFGVLPEWVSERVHASDLETLDMWVDRVMEVRSPEGLFAEL